MVPPKTYWTRLSRQSPQLGRRAAGSCSGRLKPGSIWSARAAAFARRDLGGDHPQGIVWPRGNSPVRGVAPTTTPNQRPRISQPSMRTSTPVLSHRGKAATGPRDARFLQWQPGAVVFPRAAARQSGSRPGSGCSPRQHEHVRRSMTTAAARPLSAGWGSPPRADPRRAAPPQDPGRARPAATAAADHTRPAAQNLRCTRPGHAASIASPIERRQVLGGLISEYGRAA